MKRFLASVFLSLALLVPAYSGDLGNPGDQPPCQENCDGPSEASANDSNTSMQLIWPVLANLAAFLP